jgi:hypothetical protein
MSAEAILNNDILVSAMQRTADNDHELYGELQSRAEAAVQVAVQLAEKADRQLSDKALIDIACAAVTDADPAQAALSPRHRRVGWLGGPAGIQRLRLPGKTDAARQDRHRPRPRPHIRRSGGARPE